ncbi:Hsp70 family protein [Halochromatium salexigens]|uniref:Heat-shock protein Hsp70 n=1 Tax=Halochromatium salexigens TaxID=49447 RepID=A0AAJ0UFX7_HALSE|nr:Hsp70 family protein [Halochromatium salexigens]MBK5930730.1 heat-shock protein Hsp70 [Halochromatium salexigens]
MSDIIIGIDLGTTNSEVAVLRDGRPEVLEIDGSRILPSIVGLADDGSLLVGQAARNQYALYPERTIRSVKRRMGEDVLLPMGDQSYSPQEVSALILKRLKAAAETQLGEALGKAVITVPAYFSDAQRQATRNAGELAGLEVVRIINEPTAAALAYEVNAVEPRTILVYDLGGGTFDCSVVRAGGEITEVLASHGNNHLGGDDFDAKLIAHVVTHLQEQHGCDPREDAAAMARITRACEAAKIALSDAPYARIDEEYLLPDRDPPVNLSLEISRLDYEAMIEGYLDETLEAVHTALKGAELTVTDIDEVVLVGGATRTPVIQRRLEEMLGMQPRAEIDPDLCVAAGAAIQAGVMAGQSTSTVLVDVTPYTFGTSALGEMNGMTYPYCFVPVIRKNTPIPTSKTEAFFTMVDGQEAVDVRIYQGEDRDALNNTEIGSFRIEGLSDVPAGNQILMRCDLDLDGILKVTAVEKRTGLEKHIEIDNATTRFEAQKLGAAKQRLSRLIDGDAEYVDAAEGGADADTEQHREQVQAKALLDKAERLLETASAEDKEDLIDLVEAVRDTLDASDMAGLKRSTDALADLLYYLET